MNEQEKHNKEITKERFIKEIIKEQFIQNQEKYCKENNAPFFMSRSGVCNCCRRNIIPILIEKGNDGSKLVTGCPLCHRSYCD